MTAYIRGDYVQTEDSLNPEVIGKKTEYAPDNGYGGVMVWHYNCDLPSTEEGSLLRSIGEAIK